MENKMHMTLGLGRGDTAQDIDWYSMNGVKEFYTGYVPRSWLNKYGWEVCPNRRNTSTVYNFANVSELRDMVDEIHAHGCTMNFAVNAHDNGAERMPDIKEMIELFETMNPDSYIVADPAILFCLEEWGIKRPIHLSTGIGCFNTESIRFFCERFNVERVVFPRKMTLKEMRRVVESLADLHLEYEVMVIGYRCYFNDEDCHSVHSGAGASLCAELISDNHTVLNRYPDNWKDIIEYVSNASMLEMCREGSPLDQFRKEWLGSEPPKFPVYNLPHCAEGLEGTMSMALFQNCGLCAIKELRDMGVQFLKVPLRGLSTIKRRAIEMINRVMTAENPDPAFCRSVINSPGYCNGKASCYYDVTGEEK